MKSIIAIAMFVAVASAQYTPLTLVAKPAFPKYAPLTVAPKPVFAKYTPLAVVAKPAFTQYAAVPVAVKPVEQYQHRAGEYATVPIVKFVSDVTADGFNYAYETGNGIAAQAQGSLRSAGKESALAHQGSFQWQSPEGLPVYITYVADENGYQPQGDVLPTPHPIPEAILRSIEYNRAHASKEVETRYNTRL